MKHCILSGWPKDTPDDKTLRPFYHRRSELSVEDGCLLWGSRVIVPGKGIKREGVGNVTSSPPRYIEDEEPCKVLCMVAGDGSCLRGMRQNV